MSWCISLSPAYRAYDEGPMSDDEWLRGYLATVAPRGCAPDGSRVNLRVVVFMASFFVRWRWPETGGFAYESFLPDTWEFVGSISHGYCHYLGLGPRLRPTIGLRMDSPTKSYYDTSDDDAEREVPRAL